MKMNPRTWPLRRPVSVSVSVEYTG